MPPIIAIVGRPNVGKSSLFNRLARRQTAITLDEPGVTRDRIYTEAVVAGWPAALVDTGGLTLDNDSDDFQAQVFEQAREAIAEAQIILLVVDGREGLTPLDEQVAALVRPSGKRTLVAVNKVDGPEREDVLMAEFHILGFPLHPTSAAHGYGIGSLVEALAEELAQIPPQDDDEAELGLKLTMLGRPNAGKSSLINAIVGQQRLIVSPVAGTTRDSVDVGFDHGGKRYTFVDTAGVRKKARVEDGIERLSVLRALSSSMRADVTLLVLDAAAGFGNQDKKLLAFLVRERRPFLVLINKLDLVPKDEVKVAKEHYEKELRICPYAPIVFVSALTGTGLHRILPLAEKLYVEGRVRISTGELNRAMRDALTRHQPPTVKGRRAKFYYLTQVEVAPPTFVFFVNDPALIKTSYARYLETSLRKLFGLAMAPMRIHFRGRGNKDDG